MVCETKRSPRGQRLLDSYVESRNEPFSGRSESSNGRLGSERADSQRSGKNSVCSQSAVDCGVATEFNGETDLVARLRAGDAEAVGPYIELHRRGLLSHIERNLGAGVRAKVEPEDLLQEISLTAFTALPRYDLQDRHPLNWLYQIAHRRIVGAYRRYCSSQKRASHREAPLHSASGRSAVEWLADGGRTPEQTLMRRELLEQVGRLWERLSDDQQVTLRMRYVEGKAFKEIGEALGKTDCAVRVLLCRTLDRLQAMVDVEV